MAWQPDYSTIAEAYPMHVRSLLALTLTAAVVFCAACSSTQGGAALGASGPTVNGFLGFPSATPGPTYLFALPLLTNKTGASVTVTGYSIGSVTSSARVTGYFAYSTMDTPGNEIVYDAVAGQSDGGFVVSALTDHSGQRRVLKPHGDDAIVPMVKVVLSRKVRSVLRGCVVRYRTRGHSYTQKFHCEYTLATDHP